MEQASWVLGILPIPGCDYCHQDSPVAGNLDELNPLPRQLRHRLCERLVAGERKQLGVRVRRIEDTDLRVDAQLAVRKFPRPRQDLELLGIVGGLGRFLHKPPPGRLECELERETESSLSLAHDARSRNLLDCPELAQLLREGKLIPRGVVNEGGIVPSNRPDEPVFPCLGRSGLRT